MGHQGGDFDRCKQCYYGRGLATAEPMPTDQSRMFDTTSVALCGRMLQMARVVAILDKFVAHVSGNQQILTSFKAHGAVTCMVEGDTPQKLCRDGRWTFDPQNRCYEKAWWLAWPAETSNYNRNTLGNAVEAIIGIWEAAVEHRHYLCDDVVVRSVARKLSCFCHAVYWFIQYTSTEHMPRNEWMAYVSRAQGSHEIG
jgi:hypothetical protein